MRPVALSSVSTWKLELDEKKDKHIAMYSWEQLYLSDLTFVSTLCFVQNVLTLSQYIVCSLNGVHSIEWHTFYIAIPFKRQSPLIDWFFVHIWKVEDTDINSAYSYWCFIWFLQFEVFAVILFLLIKLYWNIRMSWTKWMML